jgi:hypothetical protein
MAVKVPAPNEPKTCETCLHWVETKDTEDGKTLGLCRRYPPKAFWKQKESGPLVSFPLTLLSWSCGEHKARSGRAS